MEWLNPRARRTRSTANSPVVAAGPLDIEAVAYPPFWQSVSASLFSQVSTADRECRCIRVWMLDATTKARAARRTSLFMVEPEGRPLAQGHLHDNSL
jgi:hypothetical protein